MMKIFISQPFHGKSEEEIINRRSEILEKFEGRFRTRHGGYEVIDQHLVENAPENADRTWHLGRSIQLMGTASMVIFSKDYSLAPGCMIEREVCVLYGIPYVYEEELET